jgi:hypothetical protein
VQAPPGAKLHGPEVILFSRRTGDGHYRYGLKTWMRLQPGEQIKTVDTGQRKVQKDEVRERGLGATRPRAYATEVIDGLAPRLNTRENATVPLRLYCPPEKQRVSRLVFDQQYSAADHTAIHERLVESLHAVKGV